MEIRVHRKIKSLDELKTLASNNERPLEVFIQLNFGARSSKRIDYNRNTDYWHIFNEIDDTEQELHTEELAEKTNIIKALEGGALYQQDW